MRMKYFDQKLNRYDPSGTCNVSCLAMALSALGINVTPDELYIRARNMGLIVTHVATLTELAGAYGVIDLFTDRGTFAGIKTALDKGRPVILRGNFTDSGHIVAVESYDDKGLIVKDPWGEFFEDGYDTLASGDGLHYSWGLIARRCSPESPRDPRHIWFHQLYRKTK